MVTAHQLWIGNRETTFCCHEGYLPNFVREGLGLFQRKQFPHIISSFILHLTQKGRKVVIPGMSDVIARISFLALFGKHRVSVISRHYRYIFKIFWKDENIEKMANRVKKTQNLLFFGQAKHLGFRGSFRDFCSKKLIYGILVANVARVSIYGVNFWGFFIENGALQKYCTYIVYVWRYTPNIVYISLVSLKKNIAEAWS